MTFPAISRRHMLATLLISATGGCLTSGPFQSDDGIQLGSLFVIRPGSSDLPFKDVTDREITSDDREAPQDGRKYPIRLFREGRLVFDQVVTLAAREYVMADPSWSTELATYSLIYASEDYVNKLEISVDTAGVDVDRCNHIHMMMDVGPTAPVKHDIQIISGDHLFAEDRDGIEWTC